MLRRPRKSGVARENGAAEAEGATRADLEPPDAGFVQHSRGFGVRAQRSGRGGRPQPAASFAVVRQGDQLPFADHLGQPAQQELAEAAHVLMMPKTGSTLVFRRP